MATQTLPSTKTKHHRPPDSVRIWVSATVEADFVLRGAFPQFRYGSRDEQRSGMAIHWCDLSTAAEMLRDASARQQEVVGPVRNAYGAFIKHCKREIEEAKGRPGWLAGSEPKALPGFYDGRRHQCTRAQLRLMGMPENLKLPGDAGGPSKKASFTDVRGHTIGVTRGDFAWPGTFVASVSLSDQAMKEQAAVRAKAEQENQKLRAIDSLPTSATAFRQQVVGRFAVMTAMILEDMSASQGYRFSEDVVEAFKAEAACLLSLVREGQVVGHDRDKVKRQHLIGRAKRDPGLQTFLRLVHSSDGGE